MVKHRGITIYRSEDGYFADNGPQSFGYCDTLEEIKAEINREFAQEDAFYADMVGGFPPPDSPSLPSPWWHDR